MKLNYHKNELSINLNCSINYFASFLSLCCFFALLLLHLLWNFHSIHFHLNLSFFSYTLIVDLVNGINRKGKNEWKKRRKMNSNVISHFPFSYLTLFNIYIYIYCVICVLTNDS